MRYLRAGRFRLSRSILEDNKNFALRLLSDMIIWEAHFDPCTMCIEYTAESKYFDPVGPHSEPPKYDLQITQEQIILTNGDTIVQPTEYKFIREKTYTRYKTCGSLKMKFHQKHPLTKKGY